MLSGWTEVSEMSREEYEAIADELIQFGSDGDQGLGLGLSWIYNPTGKLITRSLTLSIIFDLMVQSHDVDDRMSVAAQAAGR